MTLRFGKMFTNLSEMELTKGGIAMTFNKYGILAAIVAFVALPLAASSDTLYDFSIYASGAATTTRVTTHGRVAVAGAPTFTNMVIGDALTNSLGTRDDLIAGGSLTYNSGTVNNGDVLYGAALTVAGWTSTAGNGAAVLGSPVFTPLTTEAAALSTYFAGLTATGAVAGGATLTLTGTNSIQDVFSLSAAEFNTAGTINIVGVNAGERIIVNVAAGTGYTKADTVITNLGTSGKTFFNFTDPAALDFTRVNFPGTILAPNAAITLTGVATTGSTIEGSLWVETITATDYTIGNAVPEPATILLLISGLASLSAFRKRPRSVA
ncbi:MAG: choice-of-anchor A family protein [Phycisphaerae bacterium]|nr:choice-of-anchor A family protein [Phycisphaerae bacterium]